ncbi:MAG: YHYH protein [Rhizobiaceae bacterium]|nr:YHYH protein [Rhizobiaceae bacterium]
MSAAVSAGATAMFLMATPTHAHNNQVKISVEGGQRCIVSNGLPNHRTGSFPNRGNPNRISKQNVHLCVTTSPSKGRRPQWVGGSIGVGINGIQFRPTTADYYDARSRRGFSRNARSGWNLDGLGARNQLGMDSNNAHVDNRGLYHYHGVANALVRSGKGSLIGWAADGFEIHYLGSKRRSGYALKRGTRGSAPGGKYDGTYVQDWKYVGGSKNLDECNGGRLNGNFVYFATETFPFLPHCLWGNVSRDFERPGRRNRKFSGVIRKSDRQQPRLGRTAFIRRGPPEEARVACQGKSSGMRCSFTNRHRNHQITGSCRTVRGGISVCVPVRGALVRP